MKEGAQGRCTGVTLKDRMGREVGGKVRMETHVHQRLIHVNVWQKPPQYCKVISLQLKKKKKKMNKQDKVILHIHSVLQDTIVEFGSILIPSFSLAIILNNFQ